MPGPDDIRAFLSQVEWIEATLPDELARRDVIETPVSVHEVSADGRAGAVSGGTIVVVSGDPTSTLVRDVRAAAERGDAAGVGRALASWQAHLQEIARSAEGGMRPQDQAPSLLGRIPSITRVTYADVPVADGLVQRGEVDAMAALLPFAGGSLRHAAFRADSYVPPGGEADVETVVCYRQPDLTPLERQLLDALSGDEEAVAIGRPDMASWPGLMAGGLAAVEDQAAAAAFEQRALEDAERARQELRAHARDNAWDDRVNIDEAEADQIQNLADLREIQERLLDLRVADERQVDRVQNLADLREIRDRLQDRFVDDLAEDRDQARDRLVDDADRERAEERRAQQERAEEERAQRDRLQQEEAQRQRQEEARNEQDARAAEAGEADAAGADVDDDDDGGSVREWLDRIDNRSLIESLDARAAVETLLRVRSGLVQRGLLR